MTLIFLGVFQINKEEIANTAMLQRSGRNFMGDQIDAIGYLDHKAKLFGSECGVPII
jgi:hypothetical protein